MRVSGLLDDPEGVEQADHVCWAYRDDDAFEEAAVRFLDEGLARGDRLMWVGEGAEERLRRADGPLAAVERLTGSGALRLITVGDGYAADGGFSPERQFAYYDAATRQAIREGYRGLRVVAELTSLAADPGLQGELLRWERLADDYVAHGPGFSALCAYRADELPLDTVADATAVHPVSASRGLAADFRLWVDEGNLHLAGDVDAFGAARLRRLLGSARLHGPVAGLDLSGLDFADLAGVRAVAGWAEACRTDSLPVELIAAPRLFRRMWQLLELADRTDASFVEASL